MSTAKTATRGSLLLLAYFAFISLGLPDGLIGVGWPSISPDLGVPLDAVGLLLIAGTTGYITSSVAAGFTIARLGVGWLLAGSTLLASLALTGYATSPVLAMMIGCALLLGLGSGAIDSGLNAYAAAAFGPRHMNWMHAFFGLGVAIGPLIMTSVISAGLSWRWGYAAVATAQAVLATAFALTARNWAAHRPVEDGDSPVLKVPIRDTLAIPAVWFGALAFAVYVAVEVAAGLWAYLLLTEGRGLSGAIAGICVSGYWASLFVGRVVQGVVAERLGSDQVLKASLAGMVVGAVLVALPAPGWVAVVGLAIIGFAAAPVFPLMTLTTANRVGPAHADRAIGVQIGAAGLGGALLPGAVGVLLNRFDVEYLGPALVVLSVLLLALYVASARKN
ncbi:MFS transporter [Phytohabitans aurantiacus]|jgi:fucose permease|uniref:MFS transporter n=1 Tax=Phytohabitans aurantiacus TaxID=3016789 RepID=A0ABQ5QQX5_9ACTN|nr:MFS transporter [Phytohabitans aurantiacus]GLH97015.1 MFS transporter [Phytohabitans aurantiacus]